MAMRRTTGWQNASNCEALRSPDFASHRSLKPINHKLRRAGCPRPRIWPRGVMEYWSVGVLRQFGIAPRVRGVGSAFRATLLAANPGLNPWPFFHRFAVRNAGQLVSEVRAVLRFAS